MKFLSHIQFRPRLISLSRIFRKAFFHSALALIAITLFSLSFLILPTDAHAQITLVWDPPESAPVPTGYLIYCGEEEGVYNSCGAVWHGTEFKFNGLNLDRSLFFAVKSFLINDDGSVEYSGFSKEAIFDPRPISVSIGFFRRIEDKGYWFFDLNNDGLWSDDQKDFRGGPFGGNPVDIPVGGYWTMDGPKKIGIFRKGMWYLDLNGSGLWNDCEIDACLGQFGGEEMDFPITGDWTGDRVTKVGIYRQGMWYLDNNGNGSWDGCGIDACLGPFGGSPEDIPVIGDWRGEEVSKIGIYRGGNWYLDMNGNGQWDGCETDKCIENFGGYYDQLPVVGDWTGNGISKIGIYQHGNWYLDFNGNGVWEGCIIDRCVAPFGGNPDDFPIIH